MLFTVLHAKEFEPMFKAEEILAKAKDPKKFNLVATVKSDTLGDVFRITNHIDHNWEDNPEVAILFKAGNRSTSVGDLVVENDSGKIWACMPSGWEEVLV